MHTVDTYTQTLNTPHRAHVSMFRHHMKTVIQNSAPTYIAWTCHTSTETDIHTLDTCTYRLTHTSLVPALSPRKLWKAGHLLEFSLLQVVESEPRVQYEW